MLHPSAVDLQHIPGGLRTSIEGRALLVSIWPCSGCAPCYGLANTGLANIERTAVLDAAC